MRNVRADRAEQLEIRSPYSGEIVGRVSADRCEDVDTVVDAGDGHDGLGSAERALLLERAAVALAGQKDEFAKSITAESGVCLKDSRREVDRAVRNLHVAAAEALRLTGEAIPLCEPDGERIAFTMREPVGLVAAITPFNRPLNQVVVKVAPALAANAPIVLKPSEKTPLTALAFAELLAACGLPPGMVGVVTGPPDVVGDALVTHPAVAMVTFTGSVATGAALARRIGLKKIAMELGGNDPLIVLRGVDLDRAARVAIAGAYATAGQSCRGIKRIIAAEAAGDALAQRLVAATMVLRCGDPFDATTDVGPLISEAAATVVEERIRRAVGDGASLRIGGWRKGALVAPTVVDHVPLATALVAEETFGPVAPILRVRDADEAIAVANATPYGLQAGVMAGDLDEALYVAARLRVGGVMIQAGPTFDSPMIPFGGVKSSGFGREGIRFAMQEMTAVKTIVVPWPRRRGGADLA